MRQRKGIINSVFSLIATALYLLRPNNMMTTTHLLLLRTKTCLKLFQVKECRAQVKDFVTSMTGVEGRISLAWVVESFVLFSVDLLWHKVFIGPLG